MEEAARSAAGRRTRRFNASMGELLTRAYLLATGRSSPDISRAVAEGELIRLASGVYTTPGDRPAHAVYRLKVLATAMTCRNAVSFESAAALHDIPFLRPSRTDVHFTVDRVHGGGRRPGVHVHPRPLTDAEITHVDGVLVTTRARTAIDVAMTGDLIRAVAAIDSVRLIRRFPSVNDPAPVGVEELSATLDRLGRRRGSATARRALELSVDCAESAGESWSRMLMMAWGMPMPRLQTSYRFGGREHFVDFEWGSLVGEFDGSGKYGDRDAERAASLEAEKERQALFSTHGMEVVRWGWSNLTNDALLRRKLSSAFARHGIEWAA
ncbi:type IV toxin-antitoxin system AbiEi family antitoxin domain-containing protein [Tsukamurella sp. USMM236]|uniref:type IV toxin-antitoxin system AbiEi family antitoxin domain-containing protein n=1 Tax=Tsukamurella sp. USMM236 TaxID=3081301 RepID=UPI00301A58D3